MALRSVHFYSVSASAYGPPFVGPNPSLSLSFSGKRLFNLSSARLSLFSLFFMNLPYLKNSSYCAVANVASRTDAK